MTKYEFLMTLTHRLSHLPREAVEERVNFYIESIEDRIEDGVPEEEAVAAVGTPEEVAEHPASYTGKYVKHFLERYKNPMAD
jgi:uncharacterized membrane protein